MVSSLKNTLSCTSEESFIINFKHKENKYVSETHIICVKSVMNNKNEFIQFNNTLIQLVKLLC